MSKGAQHVIPSLSGWKVKRSGASKASSIHQTQADAIAAGRRIAQKQKTELYIHDRDGLIRGRNSYGNDPSPPKA
ncbi:MAG: DUF2188 domain-containing protein [Hyphomonadaceae bacterium]|jgi:hypothetical protein|nr:DUF2188 domain-containing protein [Hyphomonadaceae bacterium]